MQRPTTLEIAGIELTQAVQYFDLNGQGTGTGPNNSIPLVARKDLFLRVYPNLIAPPEGILVETQVSGSLEYAHVTGSGNVAFPTLSPLNGPILARPSAEIQRGQSNDTLNFQVPAAHCTAEITFRVTLTVSGHVVRRLTSDVQFKDVPPVRVRGFGIHYTGSGLDIPPPSQQDLAHVLAIVARAYPTSGFTVVSFQVMDYSGDLTTLQGWRSLLFALQNMRTQANTTDLYLALLPVGTPEGISNTGSVLGLGGAGAAIGYNLSDAHILAQEIAHSFLREHAPGCGAPQPIDSSFPQYGQYPQGSIGEFGFGYPVSGGLVP